MTAFLDALRPGDAVYVRSGRNRRLTAASVDKITKTQIVLTDGGRYRRTTGEQVGRTDVWTTVPQLVEMTTVSRMEKAAQDRQIRTVRLRNALIDTIRACDDITILERVQAALRDES